MKEIYDILPYTILVPVVIGVGRFTVIDLRYKPFIYLLLIGLLSEVLTTIFASKRYVAPNYVENNAYILVEFIFYLWLFKNVLRSIKAIRLKALFFLGLAVWLYENLFLGRLTNGYDYYFQVGYGLALALLAIEGINQVLIKEKQNLLRNGLFLISAGMVIFYTFDIVVEIELHFATVDHKAFFKSIFAIQQWINCFVNLVFALAVLWMPTKKNFTNPSF